MINNHVSLTGIIVACYRNKYFENKLQVFEIEVEMADYKTVVLPVLYGEFTKGNNFKRGDRVVVDGVIDLIEKKVSIVASNIYNFAFIVKK